LQKNVIVRKSKNRARSEGASEYDGEVSLLVSK